MSGSCSAWTTGQRPLPLTEEILGEKRDCWQVGEGKGRPELRAMGREGGREKRLFCHSDGSVGALDQVQKIWARAWPGGIETSQKHTGLSSHSKLFVRPTLQRLERKPVAEPPLAK